ncbi:MAG: hypothetical protein A3G52_00625 [Candidatus Taylorbacteria bacterium RIFCSPLOWO2_12_FULL_43_20]|uniref:Uncharacterized protein n=1 Tax=Candidatus Taylorbacteria bacterium RIFCSPLOWO2_12_FULL_43_20 TaxID=1802332 RepID=A0A1G2P0T3_9BACT|nr:MAG: hypothetical protein A2825_00435 [Candidatus Taylorbacteria bacterium RIFCSPHIGHO2_01_FULL_43_120]OHA22750.1 MAG: hypothetical protein A3B98_01100 [Candidatus Taylorbacteria bacterium RIFCSPHIGHO2_02_FULL_43_55]OHA28660.1 MAG: hypothetical protein A3E92_01135 [Candidatus Taylorbacteria bacterium RIFCSPHIGHO2_12_FULL_42_34]OHA30667.1 MAG: hypothetical protein A3B09_00545 [Candidatus Taylorbacteria bacterium RIFCSPLOWO2_01_FULL_43_83]OHA38195.1 MAG: hypothetical protein A3H58_04480 [Candi
MILDIKKIAPVLIVTVILSIAFSFLPTPNVAYGAPSAGLQEAYKPLTKLPQKFFPQQNIDLSGFLVGMFKLLIAVSGLLAMIMIIWGGVLYMSTDAISGKSEGKEKITNAVIGLVLALGSWLIIYTINPKILEFTLFKDTPLPSDVVPNMAGQQTPNTVQILPDYNIDPLNVNTNRNVMVEGSAITEPDTPPMSNVSTGYDQSSNTVQNAPAMTEPPPTREQPNSSTRRPNQVYLVP